MQQHGRLTNWNDDKGFGFITPASGGSRVFVHISSFPRGQRRPVGNEPVTFSVARDHRQRLCAENVVFRSGAKRGAGRLRGVVPALSLSLGFFVLLSGSVVVGFVPFPVAGFYALMSAVSFFMYGLDKSAARRGAWRTAEATLHLAEVAGGWPGALVAQRVFRHKTKKQPFQFIFWCAVVANCAGLVWLLRAEEAAGLRASLF